jgi:hypothetical protein
MTKFIHKVNQIVKVKFQIIKIQIKIIQNQIFNSHYQINMISIIAENQENLVKMNNRNWRIRLI